MARRTAATPRVKRSGRRMLLRTSTGTRHVVLPGVRALRVSPEANSDPTLNDLTASLEEQWKNFRKRVRKGIPASNRKGIDTAVHDLRVSARRLLAILASLEALAGGKRSRRARRNVESLLDRLGPLRDLGVQLDMLPKVRPKSVAPALRRLAKQLARKHARMARKDRARLRRIRLGRLETDVRRLLGRTCDARASLGTRSVQRVLLDASGKQLRRLQRCRLALDPTHVQSIHSMRIALKEFRYSMEAIGPATLGVGKAELESLHDLQTAMGDLHDLEVLAASIAKHVSKLWDPLESTCRHASLSIL